MSVEHKTFLIYGVYSEDYEKFSDLDDRDDIKDYFSKDLTTGDFFVHCDGFCGEYSIFGVFLAVETEDDNLFSQISLSELNDINTRFFDFINYNNIDIEGKEPKIYLMNIYT